MNSADQNQKPSQKPEGSSAQSGHTRRHLGRREVTALRRPRALPRAPSRPLAAPPRAPSRSLAPPCAPVAPPRAPSRSLAPPRAPLRSLALPRAPSRSLAPLCAPVAPPRAPVAPPRAPSAETAVRRLFHVVCGGFCAFPRLAIFPHACFGNMSRAWFGCVITDALHMLKNDIAPNLSVQLRFSLRRELELVATSVVYFARTAFADASSPFSCSMC